MKFIIINTDYTPKQRAVYCGLTLLMIIHDLIFVLSLGYIVTGIGLWARLKFLNY